VKLSFDESGASAHEGIVDKVAGLAGAFDEEGGQLWLIARAIGDFVKSVAVPLLGGPEFVEIDGGLKGVDLTGGDFGASAEVGEVCECLLKFH